MNGETKGDNRPVDLKKSRKGFKNKTQNAGEQGGGGEKQGRTDSGALPKDRQRRKQHQRHRQRGELEDVFVPINGPMGGGEGVGEEAAGEGGQERPGEGEEGEGEAGELRRSMIEDRRSRKQHENGAVKDANSEKNRPPARRHGAFGRLGAAV